MERRQAGFSLIEMVIAMVVTLIVTGAIYQLLTAGDTAFRREPELADRQQNVRMAMDLISQDVFGAGYGMPQYLPVFKDGLNAISPLVGAMGLGNSDEIQMISTSDCGALQICRDTSSGVSVVAWVPVSACFELPGPVLLACTSGTGCPRAEIYWGTNPGGGGGGGGGTTGSCPGSNASGSDNGHIVLPSSHPMNPSGGPDFNAQYAMSARVVRYRVNLVDNVPQLERSTRGDTVEANWMVIARGIEDLQVQYRVGEDWVDSAPAAITPDAPQTIVNRVRISLSARAVDAANIVGQSTSAVGNAVRGQLSSEIVPRAARTTYGMRAGEL